MELAELLEQRQAAIIFDAHESLNKSRLHHYRRSHAVENTQRLTNLFRLVIQSVKSKNLIPSSRTRRNSPASGTTRDSTSRKCRRRTTCSKRRFGGI